MDSARPDPAQSRAFVVLPAPLGAMPAHQLHWLEELYQRAYIFARAATRDAERKRQIIFPQADSRN
jgi:hypothetical protein